MRGMIHTVTVWNKYKDHETKKDIWIRHVVNKCSWEVDIIKSVTGNVANITNTYSVLVQENENYKPYRDWKELEDKTSFFTFNIGDLVALGEHETEITGTSPLTETVVKQSLLPDVFNIKAFADETETYKQGRHYEIEGV